ncbi:hypothetical protein [Bosea sp. TAF32]|uniref:hypothetical protein n=1 Tax=Bosea sp. TAF32 TaxID=3237482 RepID=UPI003F92C679
MNYIGVSALLKLPLRKAVSALASRKVNRISIRRVEIGRQVFEIVSVFGIAR